MGTSAAVATIISTVPSAVLAHNTYWNPEARYNQSLQLIGREEMLFFRRFFDVQDISDFWDGQKVLWLQALLGFSGNNLDGIVWSQTLERIYRVYYNQPWYYNQLWSLQKTRLKVMNEILPYPRLRRWVWGNVEATVNLYPSSQPWVFNKWYYLWNTSWEPMNNDLLNPHLNASHLNSPFNTIFINSDLYDAFSHENNIPAWYHTIIKRYQGSYVLWLFIDWKLRLASYTSPWNPNRRWWSRTPRGFFPVNRVWQPDVNNRSHPTWITWSQQTLRYNSWRFTSAIMPYVCWINDRGIWVHAWSTNGQRESLWCVRLPLHYSKWFYEHFQKSWRSMSWDIRET